MWVILSCFLTPAHLGLIQQNAVTLYITLAHSSQDDILLLNNMATKDMLPDCQTVSSVPEIHWYQLFCYHFQWCMHLSSCTLQQPCSNTPCILISVPAMLHI